MRKKVALALAVIFVFCVDIFSLRALDSHEEAEDPNNSAFLPEGPRSGIWDKNHKLILFETFEKLVNMTKVNDVELVYDDSHHESAEKGSEGSPAVLVSTNYGPPYTLKIYYGIFELAHNQDELAWVLAHELGHRGHAKKRQEFIRDLERQFYARCSEAFRKECYLINKAAQKTQDICNEELEAILSKSDNMDKWCKEKHPEIFDPLVAKLAQFRHRVETEADIFGIRLVMSTGFDPDRAKQLEVHSADWVWASENPGNLGWGDIYKSKGDTHPSYLERLKTIEAELESNRFYAQEERP